MKPLSGMWLYINLAFAIVWDSVGFILFIIGLIPGIQAFAVVASPVIDVLAFLTDLTFCILYQGYVKLYNVNFRVYQIKRIKEMLKLSKSSGASNNPIAQNFARQTQKINQYMLDQFSSYVINFTVNKIQYSIITSAVEIIPWIGDFSPSWTIKANLHLREHRKTARELKIRILEFEKSLAKWRGSLKFGGIRKLKSKSRSKNIRAYRKTSSNNIRSFNRERLAGSRAQAVVKQQSINQGVRDSAANNIRPFTRRTVSGGQPTQGQNKQLANVQSTAANVAYRSGQLFGNIPQFLEYEDDRSKDKKSSADNRARYSNRESVSSGGRYMQSQNNNTEKPNGERLAGERAQAVIQPQDINQTIRDTAANNIRPFNRKRLAGGIGQNTQLQNNKLSNIKSAAGNLASMTGQVASSVSQSLEYDEDDDKLKDKKLPNNNIRTIKTRVFSDISKPIQAKENNNSNDYANNISATNSIKKFTRPQPSQVNNDQIVEEILAKK